MAYNLPAAGWSLVLHHTLAHLFAVSTVVFSPMFSPHSDAFQGHSVCNKHELSPSVKAGGYGTGG